MDQAKWVRRHIALRDKLAALIERTRDYQSKNTLRRIRRRRDRLNWAFDVNF